MESHYNEQGVDWVNWFIFENDFGEKDWTKYKTINKKPLFMYPITNPIYDRIVVFKASF